MFYQFFSRTSNLFLVVYNYYFFEDVEDHLVTVTISADLFDKEHEVEYHLNSVDELWDFLLTNKKLYFKDAE